VTAFSMPTPSKGIPVVVRPVGDEELARILGPAAPEPAPIGNGRPLKLPRRRLGRHADAMFVLVMLTTLGAGVLRVRDGMRPRAPIVAAPVVVYPFLRLDGALVLGASRDWTVRRTPPRYGDPVPVSLTAYCLKGTTRRDTYVREGIVASDPGVFPLGRYLEIYVGKTYYGRFLIDDTGHAIKGNRLDIWTPTCRDAHRFGRTRGTAVLVPRPRGEGRDTLVTGRLGGKATAEGAR
jgi:3D (Asp-Asp-Asp) domain-containing protein